MRPLTQAEGHDAPKLVDQLVPGMAAMVEYVSVGAGHPVREPVVAHELPDILDGVELGR